MDTAETSTNTIDRVRRAALGALDPRRISAIYLLGIFLLVFGLLNPETFLTETTISVVFSSGTVTCMLALAFLIPLVAEVYDLSIGAMMALSLIICTQLSQREGFPPALIPVAALAACAIFGLLNALIVVKLRVNSFIATLGVSQILLALALYISENQQIIGSFPTVWSDLGNGAVNGVPYLLLIVIGVAALIWYVLEFTAAGRHLAATGGNPEAARLSGVRTGRAITASLVASALLSGLAGVMYAAKIGLSSASVGSGLLFPAVTAVFLGASQFSRRPNVWGTLVAYFTLAFGVQGLTLSLGASVAWAAPLFEGVALVIAVSVASRPLVRKLRGSEATTPQPGSGTGSSS